MLFLRELNCDFPIFCRIKPIRFVENLIGFNELVTNLFMHTIQTKHKGEIGSFRSVFLTGELHQGF